MRTADGKGRAARRTAGKRIIEDKWDSKARRNARREDAEMFDEALWASVTIVVEGEDAAGRA